MVVVVEGGVLLEVNKVKQGAERERSVMQVKCLRVVAHDDRLLKNWYGDGAIPSRLLTPQQQGKM